MKLIDNLKLEEQQAYLIRPSFTAPDFLALDVRLTDFEQGSIVSLARQIELATAHVEGALLIEGVDHMVILAMGLSARDISDLCAGFRCEIYALELATEPLTNLSRMLERAAGRNPEMRKSTLYKSRADRDKNITLIIDDDAFLCATIQSKLKQFGECVVAGTVDAGVEAYVKHSPDCVFLDLHLAGDSGLKALESILTYDPNAYVVMLTSDSSASQAIAAKKRGAKSFVSKPAVFNRLEYELFRGPTFRRYKGERYKG